MHIYDLALLQWKSFFRSPLLEQTIVFRLLIGLWTLSLLYLLYVTGSFMEAYFGNKLTQPLILFALFSICGFVIDLLVKYLFKKPHFQFKSFFRFPESKSSINYYLIIRELYSVWNFYLLIIFFPFLSGRIYPVLGLVITITLFLFLYLVQLSISLLVNRFKENRTYSSKTKLFFRTKIELKSAIANYLLLNVKMTLRSPRLRYQMLLSVVLSGLYIYLLHHSKIESYGMRLFLISVIFLILSLGLNQFLFSAEAVFFDHLMILPRFRLILQAKYLFYLFFSVILLGTFFFIVPMNWEAVIELLAIFCYCSGTITLVSFCGILFVNTKIDLFGAQSKMITPPPTTQSLSNLLIYAVFLALAYAVYCLFSREISIYFMLFVGVISILYRNIWFNYLYKCFSANKYEKMEIFRIQ